MQDIFIVGCGTYGEVMFELAEACGYNVVGFFDDCEEKKGTKVMNVKVLGKLLDFSEIKGSYFIVAIGNNKIRHDIMTLINERGGITPSIIHPDAKISPSVKIGKGVYIHMGAIIWTKAIIEDFSIISPNTVIGHHAHVGHSCLISITSVVGAYVNVGNYTMFGIGSIAISGEIEIGENVMLGAGTTVIDNLESNVLAVGTPAKKIKDRIPILE